MQNDIKTINELMVMQKEFSDRNYDNDALSDKDKQEILKTICLSLHSETNNIALSSNFKYFDTNKEHSIDTDNLIYHAVDAMRYVFATLNLYDITPEELNRAYLEKDITLNTSAELQDPNKDQKVVVVDIDDVICEFRSYFNSWLYKTYNILVCKNSKSYYSSKEVLQAGLSPELVFERFIKDNELCNIPVIEKTKEMLYNLKSKGVYIQLLTSRPSQNLRCKYQTFQWLKENNIPYDNIGFAPEKYLWLAKKEYYIEGRVLFAVDDSAKHAMEYATHDIKCFVPKTSYNESASHNNIVHYDYDNQDIIVDNV